MLVIDKVHKEYTFQRRILSMPPLPVNWDDWDFLQRNGFSDLKLRTSKHAYSELGHGDIVKCKHLHVCTCETTFFRSLAIEEKSVFIVLLTNSISLQLTLWLRLKGFKYRFSILALNLI